MRVNNSAMNLEVRKGSESSINHVVKNLDIFDPLRGHYVKNGHLADPLPQICPRGLWMSPKAT